MHSGIKKNISSILNVIINALGIFNSRRFLIYILYNKLLYIIYILYNNNCIGNLLYN